MIVIITQNQYLLASKINHITLDEHVEYQDTRNNQGHYRSVREVHYSLRIVYVPENANTGGKGFGSNGEELRDCTVNMRGAVQAYTVFKELVEQVREQCPDQLYLDKALEKMFKGVDFNILAQKDSEQKSNIDKVMKASKAFKSKGKGNDRGTAKTRKAGKAKRASKGILRRAKSSRR